MSAPVALILAVVVWLVGSFAVLAFGHQLKCERLRLEAALAEAEREGEEAADMRAHQRQRETYRAACAEFRRANRDAAERWREARGDDGESWKR